MSGLFSPGKASTAMMFEQLRRLVGAGPGQALHLGRCRPRLLRAHGRPHRQRRARPMSRRPAAAARSATLPRWLVFSFQTRLAGEESDRAAVHPTRRRRATASTARSAAAAWPAPSCSPIHPSHHLQRSKVRSAASLGAEIFSVALAARQLQPAREFIQPSETSPARHAGADRRLARRKPAVERRRRGVGQRHVGGWRN